MVRSVSDLEVGSTRLARGTLAGTDAPPAKLWSVGWRGHVLSASAEVPIRRFLLRPQPDPQGPPARLHHCLVHLDACLFSPHTRAGVIAHRLDDAKVILRDKVRFPYNRLDEGLG